MGSIFTKIINREVPAYIVAEDDAHIAFLDINPLMLGHTLVIPKIEVDYIFDLEDKVFSDLQLFSKKVAQAIKNSVECIRIGTTVIGLEVPHAHIHLIPINTMGDMDFAKPKLSSSSVEMDAMAKKIIANYK